MTREVEDEGFLSRWARRKAREKPGEEPGEQLKPAIAKEPGPEPAPEEEASTAALETDIAPEDLPDPETLGRDDDWTPFLKRGVPAEIRTRALRRLWRLDPVFANLDGLVDYAEDYNGPQFTGVPVKTLFKVGRGMLVDEESQEPQLKVEGEGDGGAVAEEAAEPPPPEAEESAEPPERASDTPASDTPPSDGNCESGDESEIRTAAPARDKPPRRRRALAKRWGFEPGANRQDR